MANLGNTIINGILRVNGKVNSSDVISAPSFTGALTGNADTATKLANARTINDISFNGSANITIPYLKAIDLRGAYKPSNVKSGYISSVFSTLGGLDGNASDNKWVDVIGLSTWGDNGGNGVNALVVTKRTTEGQAIYHYYGDFGATTWKSKKQIAYTDSSITGNAATATKLATARTINGVNFDGTANITVADSTKLPLTGGTLSGDLNFSHARGDNPASIGWNTGTIRQRIRIFDEGTTDNNVFEFQQSRDSGGTYATLMAITADNKVKAATFVGALSGNASSATKLQTAHTIGVSGVTGTAQSFDGTANIVIPITAVPSTLLTNKSSIKGSEITDDKHWVPSNDASVANFVAMSTADFILNSDNLATGTVIAVTDGDNGYITTQATSLVCDLPLDL